MRGIETENKKKSKINPDNACSNPKQKQSVDKNLIELQRDGKNGCIKNISKLETRDKTDLEAIVGPAPEFHDAGLLVEWEIFYINLTRGLVDGRGLPFY